MKCRRGDREIFECYQCILAKSKNITDTQPKCSARVILDKNGIVTRNRIAHSKHKNHEQIHADMKSTETIENNIITLRDDFPEVAEKISVDAIYAKEIAK